MKTKWEHDSSEAEYDNYLEKIEDLVWATMDNEEWAKDEIAQYERHNQLLIRKNHAKSGSTGWLILFNLETH